MPPFRRARQVIDYIELPEPVHRIPYRRLPTPKSEAGKRTTNSGKESDINSNITTNTSDTDSGAVAAPDIDIGGAMHTMEAPAKNTGTGKAASRRSSRHPSSALSISGYSSKSRKGKQPAKVKDAFKRHIKFIDLRSPSPPPSAERARRSACADGSIAIADIAFLENGTLLVNGDFIEDEEEIAAVLAAAAANAAAQGEDRGITNNVNARAGPSGTRWSRTATPAASEVDSLFNPNIGLKNIDIDMDAHRDEVQVAGQLGAAVTRDTKVEPASPAVTLDVKPCIPSSDGPRDMKRRINNDEDAQSITSNVSRASRRMAVRAARFLATLGGRRRSVTRAAEQQEAALAAQQAQREEDEVDCCGICYVEVEDIKQTAALAGKGGEDGQGAIVSCGQQACQSLFCMGCIIEYCNRKIDMRQPAVACPACTRPLNLDALRAQAVLYDPTTADPLHQPPPPPFQIYVPWLDRFIASSAHQPVDKSAIGEFIAFVAQHAIKERGLLRWVGMQEWHIACCVEAWTIHFDSTRAVILEYLNKLPVPNDAFRLQGIQPPQTTVLSVRQMEMAYDHPERNAVQPALRDAGIYVIPAPGILSPGDARAAEVDELALIDANKKVNKHGATQRDAAVRALRDVALAMHVAELHQQERPLRAIAAIIAAGKPTAARFIVKQGQAYKAIINDLLFHPTLVRARGAVNIAPVIEYFGSNLASWRAKASAKALRDLPPSGPLDTVLKAVVPGYATAPRRELLPRVPPIGLMHVLNHNPAAVERVANLARNRNGLAQQLFAIDRQIVNAGAAYIDIPGRPLWILRQPGDQAGRNVPPPAQVAQQGAERVQAAQAAGFINVDVMPRAPVRQAPLAAYDARMGAMAAIHAQANANARGHLMAREVAADNADANANVAPVDAAANQDAGRDGNGEGVANATRGVRFENGADAHIVPANGNLDVNANVDAAANNGNINAGGDQAINIPDALRNHPRLITAVRAMRAAMAMDGRRRPLPRGVLGQAAGAAMNDRQDNRDGLMPPPAPGPRMAPNANLRPRGGVPGAQAPLPGRLMAVMNGNNHGVENDAAVPPEIFAAAQGGPEALRRAISAWLA